MANKDNEPNSSLTNKVDTNFCPIDQGHNDYSPFLCSTQKHASEIETLLSIQQAITSNLNLSDVLQFIANEAQRLTSAKLSFLYVLEEDHLYLAAMSGSEIAEQMIGHHIPIDQSLAGQSILTGQPLMITDVQENDTRVYYEAFKHFGNIGCYVTVPLTYKDHSIGVIAVADQCNTGLGGESLRILSMLAPSAAIGIENARLYQEQQERRLEAEGRHQMSESLRVMVAILNSNRSLTEILDYIVTYVSSRLLECQATAIFSLLPKDGTLIIQASHGLPVNLVDTLFLPGYRTASQAIRSGQPITVSNAQSGGSDDEANLEASSAEWALVNQLMTRYQAWLSVPLVIKGEIYGAILMYYNDPRTFTSEEINLALMFSDQVALAIENARLRSQAEQAAVIAERNRLARELHDAVSQTLFSANLIAEVIPRLWERDQDEALTRLEELHQLTRGASAEMRTLLFELRPSVFKDAKLGDLLNQLIKGFSVRSQIPISLSVEDDQILSPEVQIALYRITQEALNNLAKHANPNNASVWLKSEPEKVELKITDDGCGFNPSSVSSEHFGLSIMHERAASINANIKIKSKIGQGTQIIVVWEKPIVKEQ